MTLRTPILLTALVFLAACSSVPPPALYVLKEITTTEGTAPKPVTEGAQKTVLLGPVAVPDYLDRTDIVRRATDSRLGISDNERWGETLRAGLQRVLTADLAARLGPGYWVGTGTGHGGTPDFEIPVDVGTFEQEASGRVVLSAGWEVRSAGDEHLLTRKRTVYARVPVASSTEAVVDAMSAVLAELAGDLAATLRAGRK
ncbi:MAG: PqiC family protein [Rhodospirillaceae bacterium]